MPFGWSLSSSTKISVMSVTITPSELVQLQKTNNNVKILDVSFVMAPKPDVEQFNKEYYGNFEKLIQEKRNESFEAEHIPGAVLFNLDVANPPGKFARFDFYPSDLFEKYLSLLGINNGDSIVVYGRGPMGGMLFASRARFILKMYGIESTVLNGGLNGWKKEGFPIESGNTTVDKKGNVTINGSNDEVMISFEEMNTKDGEGENMFDNLEKMNFFDCRPKEVFEKGEGAVKGAASTGFHCRGAKNLLLSEICNEEGLKDENTIRKAILSLSLVPNSPIICSCTTGIQASLGHLALDKVGVKSRVFNGSMTEVAARASHLINQK